MEEEENEDFDPKANNQSPRDISEIDMCIAYARSQLLAKTGKRIPEWRSTTKFQPVRNIKFSNLSIEIPIGCLFYPCAGDDLEFPINFFAGHVEEFHFADSFSRNYGIPNAAKRQQLIDHEPIPWIGRVIDRPGKLIRKDINGNRVVMHNKDGLLTFLENLPTISVFFYRGDSCGEGGSGQLWQGPVLLDLVLSRVMEGGLVCTDESNGSGPLYNNLRNLSQFAYRNLTLKRLGENLAGKNGAIAVWQIVKAV